MWVMVEGMWGKDRTNERTSELLHEATQLLKTLRVPAVATNPKLKVMQIGSLNQAENELVLIDSGATHALRPAADLEEWQKSHSVTVQLADGDHWTQDEGRRILQWLEFFQAHQKRKMAMVQKMITAPEEVDKVSIGLGVGDDFETAHDVSEFAGRDHDEGGATTGSGEV